MEFDTETRSLTELGFFSVASGPAVLLEDCIYVVGGPDTRSVETYDFKKREFDIVCQLPRTIINHHCIILPKYPDLRRADCAFCAI